MWPNRRLPRIWLHLLKKSLLENFIFCAVYTTSLEVFINCNKEQSEVYLERSRTSELELSGEKS